MILPLGGDRNRIGDFLRRGRMDISANHVIMPCFRQFLSDRPDANSYACYLLIYDAKHRKI